MSRGVYVEVDDLKRTLTLTGTTFMDYDLEPSIAAASRAVDAYCGRDFDRDPTTAVTRYFQPATVQEIMIDDLATIDDSVLETDQDGDGIHERLWVFGEEYVFEPLNAEADGKPYTRICLNSFRAPIGFPQWAPRSVKLTGKFGWLELPTPVVEAATVITTALVKRKREAPFGIVGLGNELGSALRIARSDPQVAMLLDGDYVRRRIV